MDVRLTSSCEISSRRLNGSCGPQGLVTCSSLSSTFSSSKNMSKGGKDFFPTTAIQRRGCEDEIFLQEHIRLLQRPSVMRWSLSSNFYPFGNVTPMLLLNLSPRSHSCPSCGVTCESDQLNPDHQLCLTHFTFGTLAFTFV